MIWQRFERREQLRTDTPADVSRPPKDGPEMQDPYDLMHDPDELELPEDVDPSEMAESLEDELVAEEGIDLGLDPDLAVFAARDELPLDEGEDTTFR